MEEDREEDKPELNQTLRGWQIFFIATSAVIGGGIFNNDGEALEVAGPAGFLLSILLVGILAIFVLDGLSEFTQLFPAPNAVYEYVRAFVDADLAWVAGIAYWYTYSAIFAAQNLAAANLSRYWGLSQTWQTVAFYFLAPALTVAINMAPVYWFGWIETFGGLLKICLVFGSSVVLYVIANKGTDSASNGPINEGFQNNPLYASDHSRAVCYAIPLIAYSYLGVEVVAMTAFEARTSKDLRGPSQSIAYVMVLLYILCGVGESLNINWTNKHLPQIYGGVGKGNTLPYHPVAPTSTSMVVVASWDHGFPVLAGFLNGCLIFSVLSAANTSLYVASRTMYGLSREIPKTGLFGKATGWLRFIVPRTRVPAAAVFVSAISFFWLPFVQLKGGYAITALIEIIAVSASVSCLIVWAAISLAFIQYWRWLRKCEKGLSEHYPQFLRKRKGYRPFTIFGWMQPLPAIIGVVGCLVVLGFTSATWWDHPATVSKVAVAFGAPIILLPMWILFKIINRRWWVRLGDDIGVLRLELERLRMLNLKIDEREERLAQAEPLRDLHPHAAVPNNLQP